MKTKVLFIFLFSCLFTLGAEAQMISPTARTNAYLQKIRSKPALLRHFLQNMPKGGDLHHHYSGSIYGETLLKKISDDCDLFYIHTENLSLSLEDGEGFMSACHFLNPGTRRQLLQHWSIMDADEIDEPQDIDFFSSFDRYDLARDLSFEEGLKELKTRARVENLQYIETMMHSFKAKNLLENEAQDQSIRKQFAGILRSSAAAEQQEVLWATFERLYKLYDNKKLDDAVKRFNTIIVQRHEDLKLDDDEFTIRYVNYVSRVKKDPIEVFIRLMGCFKSADEEALIVGVNIVAPEHFQTAMEDYKLHMFMFRFLSEKFPDVEYSLHAGELTLGLVKPEDLSTHINDAVFIANAKRIGHGVDMAYEKEAVALMNFMKQKDIPIEVNLKSNEFILGVSHNEHPILLFHKFNVPFVIATDDEGVLRSDITEQYMMLIERYDFVDYPYLKKLVFNSIQYAFLDKKKKKELTKQLQMKFRAFEQEVKMWK